MRWVLDETAPWFDADWTRAEIARRREELADHPADEKLIGYIARLEDDLAMIEAAPPRPQNLPVGGLGL